MRVIHGVWAHGALCLWAEDPDLPPRSGTEAATPSGMHLPRPHPFACQATELADLLAGIAARVGQRVGRRRGPQGRPRRADPAAAVGRRRPAGLAGTRPPGGAGNAGSPGGSGSGPARPGVAGELAGAGARPRPRRRARGAQCFRMEFPDALPDSAVPVCRTAPRSPAGR